MRVLVACEFSGIVSDAFRARGHDAWSYDLLPTEQPGPHIQGDCLSVLDGWLPVMFGGNAGVTKTTKAKTMCHPTTERRIVVAHIKESQTQWPNSGALLRDLP